MKKHQRNRRTFATVLTGIILLVALFLSANQSTPVEDPEIKQKTAEKSAVVTDNSDQPLAIDKLEELDVKGRSPKTGYSRAQFGNGWAKWGKCDTRQRILARDMIDVVLDKNGCTVLSGLLIDTYTGKTIEFKRGAGTSTEVQIDHVVALSDAWQKGAQKLTAVEREQFANDDLELLAVDGPANMQKSDGDAATWLPSNKAFRCQYVARQIAIKVKYNLWVTAAEKDAIARVLGDCPDERLPAR